MWEPQKISYSSKENFYAELAGEMEGLRDSSFIANAANLSALLYFHMPDLNWAGFYLFDGRELVLGPFQGYPACVRIGLGKGVCGTAAARREPLLVTDVEKFPGHISCDARSRSELVLPVVVDGDLIGVLDLDSPKLARFDDADVAGISKLILILTRE